MSKIVFFCIPAHGHTNPTLGVVRELALRGHQVRYYSYDAFQEKIEQAGAEFVSCDKYDITQQMSRPESGPGAAQRKPGTALQAPDSQDAARIGKDLAFSTKLLVDTTLALDDMVCRDMALFRPDCIVADSMAVWGKAVALKLGIPFVSSTTTFAFNQYPLTSEQKGVAARTAQLDARLLLKKESPAQIRRAVDYMLSNPSYRKNAAKISDSFKRCGGAKSAADKILKACAV